MNDAGIIAATATPSPFAADVRYYLSLQPRQLPSKYLYDALGSALFDAITHLPWYLPTRAEARLLETHATAIFAALDPPVTLVELGPGNGDKLLALIRAGAGQVPLDIHLIDVSPSSLRRAAQALSDRPGTRVVTHEATYEIGLDRFRDDRRGRRPALALFLGSNIGNFDPPACDAFLRHLRAALRAGDALLLGTDLVKPEPDLLVAYDDPLGVTAAFNRNLLVRLNRELGADCDVHAFDHRAVWKKAESRVEMHLVSRRRQQIRIAGAAFDFEMAPGETIWTESSYKFEPEQVASLLGRTGFDTTHQWIDADGRFALTLAHAR